jgi:uncharacterized protein (DUF58 family)
MFALPRRRERIRLTFAGYVLCIVGICLGMAAYNNASNILFLALSLTLAMLGLSGVLAWMNFRKLEWRMIPPSRLRVGEPAPVSVTVRNGRRHLPAFALRFGVSASPGVDRSIVRFRDPLDPGEEAARVWEFAPTARGETVLRLDGVTSSHPFALMEKTVGTPRMMRVIVWPARVAYAFEPETGRMLRREGDMHRKGSGAELIGLREYLPGDAMRLIHWKASAKRGRLLIRETAEPGEAGFSLRFDSGMFTRAGDACFEKACSLAGTLAEDLFHKGKLTAVATGDDAFTPVKRIGDLHAFLDRLAALRRTDVVTPPGTLSAETLSLAPGPGDVVHVRLRDQIVGEA